MKKWIFIVVIVGMLSWAVFDFINSSNKSAEEVDTQKAEEEDATVGLEIGNKAPDFQLQTLTGDNVKLSDFRDKRVMINFWATWCPPCRAEMPDIEKFHQDKDAVILAVNLSDTEKDVQQIEDFVDEYKLTFPTLLDANLDAANLYKIQPIPTTYMVDSNGIIQYKTLGAMNYDLMVQEYEKMD